VYVKKSVLDFSHQAARQICRKALGFTDKLYFFLLELGSHQLQETAHQMYTTGSVIGKA